MKKRVPLSKKGSGKYFRKTATRTHKKNVMPRPMRGGIRL
ncbi:hypothetical protein [Microviridae sp.]|nr:hypothetical protein [Microviridae sp.]